jgi:autotransporter adhesin
VALGAGSVANVANTVSVGAVGSERKIVNLAAGTIAAGSTDAINGGQLLTANQRVAQVFGGGAGLDGNGQLTPPTYNIQGTNYNDVGSAFVAVNAQLGSGGASPYFKANSSGPAAQATGTDALAMGSNAQSGGSNSVAIGTNSVASQSGAIAMGFNAAATGVNAIAIGSGATATGSIATGANSAAANGGAAYGDNSVATGANAAAFGTGAQATAANSVAIGAGSVASAANTVSVGAPGAERRVTNVAAGIAPTDAANMGQLNSMASGFQSQVSGLQTQINDNNHEARAGTAIALALGGTANLQPGRRFALSASYGNFQGSNALGVGATALLYDTRSHAVTFNAGVGLSMDTNVVGTRGAVSLQW